MEETSRREGSTKSVLLIADADPHHIGYTYINYLQETFIRDNQIDWKEEANPIKDYIEGGERVLRGYKKQFVSRDGKYRCMDMDITRTDKETGERLVNINTISQLIYNGTKYIVD